MVSGHLQEIKDIRRGHLLSSAFFCRLELSQHGVDVQLLLAGTPGPLHVPASHGGEHREQSCALPVTSGATHPRHSVLTLVRSLWLLQAKIFPAPSAWAPMSDPGSDVTCSRGLPDPDLKQLPHRPAALNHIAGLFGFTDTVAGCALPADFLADKV